MYSTYGLHLEDELLYRRTVNTVDERLVNITLRATFPDADVPALDSYVHTTTFGVPPKVPENVCE